MSSSQKQYDPCDVYNRMPEWKKNRLHLNHNEMEKNPTPQSNYFQPLFDLLSTLSATVAMQGMCWVLRESCGVFSSLPLRDSILKLPTFEKLIHTSVRSQGSPASTALGFHWELKSSACPCINSLSIICTSLVCSLFLPLCPQSISL